MGHAASSLAIRLRLSDVALVTPARAAVMIWSRTCRPGGCDRLVLARRFRAAGPADPVVAALPRPAVVVIACVVWSGLLQDEHVAVRVAEDGLGGPWLPLRRAVELDTGGVQPLVFGVEVIAGQHEPAQ